MRAFEERRDYLPGMSEAQKIDLLGRISYRSYLEKYVGVDPQVLALYQRWGMSYWCVGMDEVPALDILGYGDGGDLPGLGATLASKDGRGAEPYIFHFPDGNASIARLLVRRLNPAAVPGKTMEDVVTARLDYAALDASRLPVRIRLNATAVNVAHTASQEAVDVTYVSGGRARTARGTHCVLACYNSAIPYLCPELPEAQRRGLRQAVKAPLVYTKVAVPHWRWFAELGTRYVYYTNGFYKQVELDYPVSMGDYRFGRLTGRTHGTAPLSRALFFRHSGPRAVARRQAANAGDRVSVSSNATCASNWMKPWAEPVLTRTAILPPSPSTGGHMAMPTTRTCSGRPEAMAIPRGWKLAGPSAESP